MSMPIYDDGQRRIYTTDSGALAISEYGAWIPGCYADYATATAAFNYDNATLQAIQDRLNATVDEPDQRLITSAMLEAER